MWITDDHGANEAAYALLFPELNALMSSLFSTVPDTDLVKHTFHADIRLGCNAAPTRGNCTRNLKDGAPFGRDLNNGYEQMLRADLHGSRRAARLHGQQPGLLRGARAILPVAGPGRAGRPGVADAGRAAPPFKRP